MFKWLVRGKTEWIFWWGIGLLYAIIHNQPLWGIVAAILILASVIKEKEQKMGIKKHIKKINKVSPFGLLALGFVVGMAVMYLYFQPKLAYQTKTASDWKNLKIR